MMASLKRSSKSFRRQGSSGLVWDDHQLAQEVHQFMQREGKLGELKHCHSLGGTGAAMLVDRGGSKTTPEFVSRSLSAPNPIPRFPKFVRRGLLTGVFGKLPNLDNISK